MLRGTDYVEATGLRCRRGADGTKDDAARVATAPTRQQSAAESSSAPAVPARTCAAWLIPGRPVGTTPPRSPSVIKPMAVLIKTTLPSNFPQLQCQRVVLPAGVSMSTKS